MAWGAPNRTGAYATAWGAGNSLRMPTTPLMGEARGGFETRTYVLNWRRP